MSPLPSKAEVETGLWGIITEAARGVSDLTGLTLPSIRARCFLAGRRPEARDIGRRAVAARLSAFTS
jgi:hypothetical protein